uniref:Uncharacterized protein n=1 Tax=Noctiluca scintillans TaxID=2966 RepID=A0A7S1B1B5_NOCSC
MGANHGIGLPGICCCYQNESTVVAEISAVPLGSVRDDTMTLVFETGSGTTARVTFSERPIGLKYTKSIPLTVTEVNTDSHAHDLGVQVGWKLKEVGTVKVDSADACGTLARKSALLPLM